MKTMNSNELSDCAKAIEPEVEGKNLARCLYSYIVSQDYGIEMMAFLGHLAERIIQNHHGEHCRKMMEIVFAIGDAFQMWQE